MVVKSRKKLCPAGHGQEASWDVCPYCAGEREDLSQTRVQGLGETRVVGQEVGTPPLVGWLVLLSGEQRGEVFPLREGKTMIGRDPSCQVRILDDGISDTHARLLSEPGEGEARHVLVDLDSTNGTFLNERGRRIEREEVVDGDLLRVGDTELILKCLPKGAVARLRP